MAIVRKEDWPEILAEFFALRSVQDLPSATFAWGTHDCALFVCDAVRAMTAVDLAADFRFKYSSERGALRVMQTFAGGGLAELADKMAAQHGLAEVPQLMAQRGDIVLVTSESGEPALGIVSMNGWDIFVVGKQGLVTRPLDAAVKAWRIPSCLS